MMPTYSDNKGIFIFDLIIDAEAIPDLILNTLQQQSLIETLYVGLTGLPVSGRVSGRAKNKAFTSTSLVSRWNTVANSYDASTFP